ncbi:MULTISPECIES: hypothetical protein [unclassified Microbacterium]|uniref:hypothetical protein n=1 Tax=unclassified Microbacterium TaxID=2609290 RepID=UPI0028831D59|nr:MULTISPECIES: hypothetical protein [unclassified Microbacterium]
MSTAPTDLMIEDFSEAPVGFLSRTRAAVSNKRGLSASLSEVLGAVGISVAVLALATVGVGAAITFGQNSSAQTELESIKSAQVLYQSTHGSFGTLEQLTTATDTSAAALTTLPDKVAIVLSDDLTNYCAVSTSASMFAPSYWMTAKSGKVIPDTPPSDGGVLCPAPQK